MRSSLALLVLVGTLVGAPVAASAAGSAAADLDAQLLARVNSARAANGLHRLSLSPGLAAAARLHSRELVKTGLFQHESADGTPFWKRIERYYGRSGFRSWSVGETQFWSAADTTAAAVVSAWLASPPHRAILLDPKWRELGVSAARDTTASGGTAVTADFGVRAR